ncbi:hypothetical protein Vafri_19966 [Volvox africanus]|nr:hypothetical protein Vafri_19966 [Volvox africanus]
MARLVAVSLMIGALLCCAASASRVAPWARLERLGGDAQTIKWLQQNLRLQGSEEKEEGCAIIATKYEVPPSMRRDFVDAWMKVQQQTMDEETTNMYDMKKTMGDNVFFWTYGEWESMEKFMDHFTADYMTEFLSFLDEKDIMWHMYPLKNVTDNAAMHKDESVSRKKGDDPRDMKAHVVIEYQVPPSKVGEFIDAWKDCAMDTWEEKDNSLYALRKVASMNHHFVAYGTWESYDAYMDHFMSKHTRKLREFLDDTNIMYFSDPLMSMTDTSGKQL